MSRGRRMAEVAFSKMAEKSENPNVKALGGNDSAGSDRGPDKGESLTDSD
jgi:hypothetical protein